MAGELKNNSPPAHRLSVVPASYLILRRGNEVLFSQRANTGYMDGSYSLPAGHFDGGESADMAIVREAKEEIGVDIRASDLKLVHVLHRVALEGDYERIDFFFETDTWQGEITNMEPHKCSDLAWRSLNDLPDTMTPEVAQAIPCIKKGEIFSTLSFN